ncbi:MAG: hypothetical protein ACLQLC_04335 [Candidatus Sulfotelmatobacter sp.]
MKQIGFLTSLFTAVLLLTVAFPVGAAAPAPPPHERVGHALEELHHAREHMEHAEGEFRGHRDAAIHHIDEAIREAEICMHEP